MNKKYLLYKKMCENNKISRNVFSFNKASQNRSAIFFAPHIFMAGLPIPLPMGPGTRVGLDGEFWGNCTH